MNAVVLRKPLVLIDFEKEKALWGGLYATMPGAALHPSFEMYWPILAMIYSNYVNHPEWGRERALQVFSDAPLICARSLSVFQKQVVFERVWSRIFGAAG
jgi:hypothetical protein